MERRALASANICRCWTNFFPLRSRLHLQQHVSHTHQVVVEDISRYVEKPENGWVRNRVIDIAARFASHNNVAHSQNRELLRNICGLNFQNLAELIDSLLAVTETIQNPDTNRVRESLEKLRLEVGELLRHRDPCVHACCNLRSLLSQLSLIACWVVGYY